MLGALAALMVIAGCPSEGHPAGETADAGGAEHLPSGDPDAMLADVPADSRLSALSTPKRMQLCEEIEDGFSAALTPETRKQMECLERIIPMTVMSRRIDVPRCEALLERCLAGETIAERGPTDPQLSWGVPDCADGRLTEALASCDVTVAEFRGCIRAAMEMVDMRVRAQDCQGLQDQMTAPDPPVTKGCEALQKCGMQW